MFWLRRGFDAAPPPPPRGCGWMDGTESGVVGRQRVPVRRVATSHDSYASSVVGSGSVRTLKLGFSMYMHI